MLSSWKILLLSNGLGEMLKLYEGYAEIKMCCNIPNLIVFIIRLLIGQWSLVFPANNKRMVSLLVRFSYPDHDLK